MGHKCFISFKTVDMEYKKYIQEELDIDMIDKSLNSPINSTDEDYIMRKIREDYLSDSTVTIFLIGTQSAETSANNTYIKRELQASLYNGTGNTRSGILGVVLPDMTDRIYLGDSTCTTCNELHRTMGINNRNLIKEFSYNYHIPNNKCCWNEEDRYCILTKWDDFCESPDYYINLAFDKRTDKIANKVKVRP